MTVYWKTVCIECEHHKRESPEAPWYDHICLCPELERQSEQDPVTGVIGVIGTGEKHPHCRDHNWGNCEHFLAQ